MYIINQSNYDGKTTCPFCGYTFNLKVTVTVEISEYVPKPKKVAEKEVKVSGGYGSTYTTVGTTINPTWTEVAHDFNIDEADRANARINIPQPNRFVEDTRPGWMAMAHEMLGIDFQVLENLDDEPRAEVINELNRLIAQRGTEAATLRVPRVNPVNAPIEQAATPIDMPATPQVGEARPRRRRATNGGTNGNTNG
jgi:hypothetical protein